MPLYKNTYNYLLLPIITYYYLLLPIITYIMSFLTKMTICQLHAQFDLKSSSFLAECEDTFQFLRTLTMHSGLGIVLGV